jgi:hypothetical protein
LQQQRNQKTISHEEYTRTEAAIEKRRDEIE